MDSNKPAQNIQDSFLNTARKERLSITIYLLSGVKLTGRIRSFDKYSVVLEANGQEQLIFKHAISTVVMGRVTSTHVAHVPHPEKRRLASDARVPAAGGERCRAPRIRIRRFPFGKFSSQEIPRHRARLADVCLWELKSFARNQSANAHFWWRSMSAPAGAAVRKGGDGASRGGARAAGRTSQAEAAGHAGFKIQRQAQHSRVRRRRVPGRTSHAGRKRRREVVGEILQRRDRPDPATLIGAGKLEEIAGAAASVNADVLLFDHDLSPSQQRNIEKIIQRRVIDRTQLILEFLRGMRARGKASCRWSWRSCST